MLELYIDTANAQQVTVALKQKGKVLKEMVGKNKQGSQSLLPLVKKILAGRKVSGIFVNKGPGSFTGLKVGVSVANALGFALGVKVNGEKTEVNIFY